MALDRLSGCIGDIEAAVELLPGTGLFHDQFRITKFLNSGGFGITYLARDSLNREVVVKECFADAFCCRSQGRVIARYESNKIPMKGIMRSFLNEAHTLAALSHPNIVGVHQVFEDNDTAYMALDYISGHDLLDIIDGKEASLTPNQIVALARKLFSAVSHVHERQLIHCDISPENICVRSDGEPILIDFGAARKTIGGVGQRHLGLTMVKDGYSPPELYTPDGTCGPWSDIYSLGASLYHAVSGTAPVDCQSRLAAEIEGQPDPLKPLAGSLPGYPQSFLASIDKAMAVRPEARHLSVQDWLRAFAPLPAPRERSVVLLRRAAVAVTPARPAQLQAQRQS